eukprot:663265-Karenia_brevis.AAC.1
MPPNFLHHAHARQEMINLFNKELTTMANFSLRQEACNLGPIASEGFTWLSDQEEDATIIEIAEKREELRKRARNLTVQ